MEPTVYTFCGYKYGSFTAERTGETINYCNMFVISPIPGKENDNLHFGGYQAEKFKCVSPDVFKDLEPQQKVNLYFDQRGRVTWAQPVK